MLHVSPIDEVMRGGRLRWLGHVQRRNANVTWRVMNLALPCTRRRRGPKKTWYQQIKDDMTDVGVTQDVAIYRNEWRRRTPPTPRRWGQCHQGNVSKVSNSVAYNVTVWRSRRLAFDRRLAICSSHDSMDMIWHTNNFAHTKWCSGTIVIRCA